ncbi:hypothetical protein BC940DRAFT_363192 [Gongronella butleri]|nr:hypothetical protein BC940DRAFT_363192 [Gongronella butleri]
MNSLPFELVSMVLERVQTRDMLEARLVSRVWCQIASKVASDNIIFRFDRLQPMIQHLNAGGTMQLAIKRLLVYLTDDDVWENRVCEILDFVNHLLPYLENVHDLELELETVFNVFFAECNPTTLSKLVCLPGLIDLTARSEEMRSIAPHFSTALQKIHIRWSDNNPEDLHLVLVIVRNFPVLRDFRIECLTSDQVNSQPLRPFVYESLEKERQSPSIRRLCLDIFYKQPPQAEPCNIMDLVYFLLYLMPNLDSLELQLDLQSSKDIHGSLTPLDHARIPGNVVCPQKLSITAIDLTFARSLDGDFTSRSIFQAGNGTRALNSLVLNANCLDLLAFLPLEDAKSLCIAEWAPFYKTPSWSAPWSLNAPQLETIHLDHFRMRCPLLKQPFSPVKFLRFDSCLFHSPGTLEQLLLQLPTAKNFFFNDHSFETLQFTPLVKPQNPWTDVLFYLFEDAGENFHWLSLPVHVDTLVTRQDRHGLQIVLQDIRHATGPSVTIWRPDSLHKVARTLPADDMPILLERLEHYKNQLANGESPRFVFDDSPVNCAFNSLCFHQSATVYACTSLTNLSIQFS